MSNARHARLFMLWTFGTGGHQWRSGSITTRQSCGYLYDFYLTSHNFFCVASFCACLNVPAQIQDQTIISIEECQDLRVTSAGSRIAPFQARSQLGS